jgi:catechol 2,3-dioxygenase-like lactoylglutathione lyase family enzyme
MASIISGIQQIGIGVTDVEQAWRFYRKYFGMNIKVFEEAAEAPLMTQYTGDEVRSRNAILALNMQGGGGMEVWQFTSRVGQGPAFSLQLGDTGIYICKIKARDVAATFKFFKREGLDVLGDLSTDPQNNPHFYLRDAVGNIFEIVQGNDWFGKTSDYCGGPMGVVTGVSDIDKSLKLYQGALGYDIFAYDKTEKFHDLSVLPGGDKEVRRVLLRHSRPRKGPFSKFFGNSEIELVEAKKYKPRKIFQDRQWGDLGYIHLCFDVQRMNDLKEECAAAGFPFTIDSDNSFDMGQAAGRFTYLEDPDGTLIEFVETHKVPIVAKFGWYLNLKNRDPEKPMPNWMLKALRFNRVKD